MSGRKVAPGGGIPDLFSPKGRSQTKKFKIPSLPRGDETTSVDDDNVGANIEVRGNC